MVVVLVTAVRDELRAGTSFIPHFGQRSGSSLVDLRVHRARVSSPRAAVASSFIPHLGHEPGSSLTTSGCIGQA